MASKFASSLSSSVPVANQLTITDLPEVLQLLRRHGYSGVSYNLGLYLGLSSTTLDAIRRNSKEDSERCLRQCLTKWLQKADNVQKTKSGPSIYSLVSALRKLGENGVADRIDMEIHPACRIFARYTLNQSLLSVLPQLVTELCGAELIQESIAPQYEQGEELLGEIKAAVCKDYKKIEAFANILCKFTATADIGSAIMRDYSKYMYYNIYQ
ncbi:PREDICTED: uncharacterized protein LOC109590543 [Amphimedon queenslandica]|uniref:Death domain-containing protein n=1 Tax=Amphimedon queenslandica TaxID=400682 RepID=A0AAN0JXS8_AMPQE|nr:PREDICTED: uncharacterized protein LOC109590543 [Amphimedon queenslandica]|eukprot:XP_019862002.1 PREDICTED: uncharacterized protein LOC109590543 [Amphimedon queenslandica]